eukprot:TRINITY_DN5609_c0_g1_i2.p2 TRINITY_DN5609_c0_g1~~TRINITY_DN5609_c0_g1_i2.p2  ORF type:complete len:199 (-),score=73.36 TRINITY_DN5609_c0_g1_i2:29-625(-)
MLMLFVVVQRLVFDDLFGFAMCRPERYKLSDTPTEFGTKVAEQVVKLFSGMMQGREFDESNPLEAPFAFLNPEIKDRRENGSDWLVECADDIEDPTQAEIESDILDSEEIIPGLLTLHATMKENQYHVETYLKHHNDEESAAELCAAVGAEVEREYAALDLDTIDLSVAVRRGFMNKKGHGKMAPWKKRYFSFKQVTG